MQAGQDLKLADLIVRRRKYLEAQRENEFVFTDLIVGPYADDFHFLYELIQNAEDAGATYLHFELSVDCLRLRYDGKEFSAADVDAITGISNLNNQKKEKESSSIGRFGIGFKSVFKITERPRIRSGKFDFEIEDFILPVVHSETADFGETLLELPFRTNEQAIPHLAEALQARLEALEPHNLLFLSSLLELSFTWGEGQQRFLRNSVEPLITTPTALVANVTITGDAEPACYLLFQAEVECAAFQNETAPPPRLMLAFRQDASKPNRLVRAECSQAFAFFRTNHETNLQFLVHGPFETTLDRGDFKKGAINDILLAELASLLCRALRKYFLRNELITIDFLNLLPLKPVEPGGNTWFYKKFFEATREELRSGRAYYPTHQVGQWVAASQLLLGYGKAREALSELLNLPEQIEPLFPGRTHWLPNELLQTNYPVLHHYLKKELQVPEVKVVDFAKQLVANPTYVPMASPEWLNQFYAFLRGQRELWAAPSSSTSRDGGALRYQRIIRLAGEPAEYLAPFDENDQPQVFLPTAEGRTVWLDRCVAPALLEQEESRAFLAEDLGLKEPDNVDEIERQILPLYAAERLPEPALHQEHMAVLTQVYQNKNQRAKLVKLLKTGSPRFIRAAATDAAETGAYVNCTEAYLPNDELARFLEPAKTIRYVDQHCYAAIEGPWRHMLEACGVRTTFPWTLVAETEWDAVQRQQLRADAYQDDGTCTEELEMKDRRMDGLEEFLRQPTSQTPENALVLWNVLVRFAESGRKKKAFTGEYCWRFGTEARRTSFDTQIRQLLETTAWLPGPIADDGSQSWKTVPETVFSELPAEYEKASAGARFLKEELRWKFSWEDGIPSKERGQLELFREWERRGTDVGKLTEQQAKAKELNLNFDEIIREAESARQAQQNREALVNQAPHLTDQQVVIQSWGSATNGAGTSSVVAEPSVSGRSAEPSAPPEPAPDSPLQAHLDRIGQRGEELVWAALQARYATLGRTPIAPTDETPTCRRYQDLEGNHFELEWGNDATRTSVGYDFTERRKMTGETAWQITGYHEAKASEDPSKGWFEVSEAQWQLAQRLHDQGEGSTFTLWLVQGAFAMQPIITPIPNPISEWQAGRLRADPVRVGF